MTISEKKIIQKKMFTFYLSYHIRSTINDIIIKLNLYKIKY